MSDIPKSERSWSKLETQSLAYALRRDITAELMMSFGFSEKHLTSYVKKQTEYLAPCPDERKKAMKELYRQMSDYSCWLIEHERDDISNLTRDIVRHIRMANSIYPTYYEEYLDRRNELNQARKACNALNDELQYLASALPADKNRYVGLVLKVEELFQKIGRLRSSDNRFLDVLPDVPDSVKARREAEKKKNKSNH